MAENQLSSALLDGRAIEMSLLKKTSSEILFNSKLETIKLKGMKEEMNEAASYLKDLFPVMIDTPFKGSSLVMTQDEKKYVFGSREGRLAIVDRDTKQVTVDIDLGQGSIWTITLIENDKYILSAGASGTIKKLLFSDLTVVDEFIGHTDEINFIQVTKDQKIMYTGSDDNTVRKWNLDKPSDENRETTLYNHNGIVYCLDLSADENYIASCSGDSAVIVFSLLEGNVIATLTNSDSSVWAVKISTSNTRIVAGNQSGIVYVWKFGTWELERTLVGHTARVRYMDMSKDESFVVTAGLDYNIKVWDMTSLRKEITLKGHKDWVKFTLISKDQSTIFSISDDCKVASWKIPKFTDQLSMSHPSDNFESIDSSYQYAYSLSEGNIVGYDFSGNKIQEFDLQGNQVIQYEISQSGHTLYIFSSREGKYFLLTWNLNTGTKIKENEIPLENVYSGVVFPNENYVAIGENVRVTIFNRDTFNPVHTFRSHKGNVVKLAASYDGLRLFSSDPSGVVKVYSHNAKWEEVHMIDERYELTILQISKDNEYLFTSTGDSLKVWSLKSLGLMYEIKDFSSKKLYFTNDFDYFVHSTPEKVYVRDLDNFEVSFAIKCNSNIKDFTLSPDESLILVTSGVETTFISNPLKNNHLSLVGNTEQLYDFIEYIHKILVLNEGYDKEFDNWIIEPYHINPVHIYANFNKSDILREAITNHAPFFPSRSGYTPLSIAVEKKFMDSIESVYKALKDRLEKGDVWAFYHLGESIQGLNLLGFENMDKIYELGLQRSKDPALPKFCVEYAALPVVVLSEHPTLNATDFPNVSIFADEGKAIAFGQTGFRLNLIPGSQGSLDLIESILECENEKIYYTKLVQIILQMK